MEESKLEQKLDKLSLCGIKIAISDKRDKKADITKIKEGVRNLCIPEGIKIIDVFTYYPENLSGMIGVERIIFPEGLVKIMGYAFQDFTGVKDIKFPSSLEDLGEETFIDSFNGADIDLSKTKIEVISGNCF